MPDVAMIKKYANRRLYNTQTSIYITLDDLRNMVRDDEEFTVTDARTGQDITQQVLTQIIMEEETRGGALMPVGFLRHLIRFYDDSVQSILPQYLEMSMDVFLAQQKRLRDGAGQLVSGFSVFDPIRQMDELRRANMDMFQKAMTMMNPFGFTAGTEARGAGEASAADPKDAHIEFLTHEVEQLRAELAAAKMKAPKK